MGGSLIQLAIPAWQIMGRSA